MRDDAEVGGASRRVGTPMQIVVEQDGLSGHAEDFSPVKLAAPLPVGSLQTIVPVRADASFVYAA